MNHNPRPGVEYGLSLLKPWIAQHCRSENQFIERVQATGISIQRGSMLNLLSGEMVRVSSDIALAISEVTEGAVPVGAWVARKIVQETTVPATVRAA